MDEAIISLFSGNLLDSFPGFFLGGHAAGCLSRVSSSIGRPCVWLLDEVLKGGHGFLSRLVLVC